MFSSSGTSNDRLWFKCSLKLGQLLLDVNDVPRLKVVIRDLLMASAMGVESTNAARGAGFDEATDFEGKAEPQGAHMMEIFSLQIQMYSKTRDTKKLKDLYTKATLVQNNVPHPRTLAIIHECGGKTYMQEKQYEKAKDAFFIAFKGFDEAGDTSRLRVLRYLLMASMLHASAINPLDSPEARPYKDAPEIVAMTKLVGFYHDKQIKNFEEVLRRNEGRVLDDPFIAAYMDDLLRTMRMNVLLSILEPFTRVTLEFLASELNNISVEDVEKLLVALILDGKLQGKIDQVRAELVLDKASDTSLEKENKRNAALKVRFFLLHGSSGFMVILKRLHIPSLQSNTPCCALPTLRFTSLRLASSSHLSPPSQSLSATLTSVLIELNDSVPGKATSKRPGPSSVAGPMSSVMHYQGMEEMGDPSFHYSMGAGRDMEPIL